MSNLGCRGPSKTSSKPNGPLDEGKSWPGVPEKCTRVMMYEFDIVDGSRTGLNVCAPCSVGCK
jgi:hypothetical protein